MQKGPGLATPQQRLRKGSPFRSPFSLILNAKQVRIHPWLQVAKALLPFPPLPTLLTDKQAGGSHVSSAAGFADSLSLLIKITYLPAGEEPTSRPCPGTALGTMPSFLPWS